MQAATDAAAELGLEAHLINGGHFRIVVKKQQ